LSETLLKVGLNAKHWKIFGYRKVTYSKLKKTST